MEFGSPRKRTMPSERKVFGIPVITFAVIFALFLSVLYFASGYASENTKLIEKYSYAKAKILSISRLLEKLDVKQKQCQAEVKRYEDSNREQTLKLTRCEKAKQQGEAQKSACDGQVRMLQQFYLSVKVNIIQSGNIRAFLSSYRFCSC